jgi:hypothetical protein
LFGQLFGKLCRMWSSVAKAVTAYMKYQRHECHFDFFGVDVIADTNDECWLIEANRSDICGIRIYKNKLFSPVGSLGWKARQIIKRRKTYFMIR